MVMDIKQLTKDFLTSEYIMRRASLDWFKECVALIKSDPESHSNLRPIEWYQQTIRIREPELQVLHEMIKFME